MKERVPPPKVYIVEISRPVIGDQWRIRTLCDTHDDVVFPNDALIELMGSRDVVYYRGVFDVQAGWHFIKRCDQHGRPIQRAFT
jgi:hypothetical protein